MEPQNSARETQMNFVTVIQSAERAEQNERVLWLGIMRIGSTLKGNEAAFNVTFVKTTLICFVLFVGYVKGGSTD